MDPSPFSLAGKTALITGGGSGLGAGMAAAFAEAGARVLLVGRDPEKLRHTADVLGGVATPLAADLRDPDSLRGLAERCGPVDILVSNAGVHLKKEATETTLADMEAVLRTHVTGPQELIRLLFPRLRERGGSVLLVTSMTAMMGMTRVIAYTAAKSALLGMVRAYSAEFAPQGVRVNAIAPGWIESPMLRQALAGDPERERRILQRTALGRFGEPADIGRTAVFLSSPAARYITGVTLPVDGGASANF